MAYVREIYASLQRLAPVEWKLGFDNVGLLVGDMDAGVTRVIAALDITDKVVDEAAEWGAELIVSHHPMFFELKSVRADDVTGRRVLKLARNGISAICMHTNLDAAFGGVNDCLASALGLRDTSLYEVGGTSADGREYGIGRIGDIDRTALHDFLPKVKTALSANGLRYVDAGREVHKVAVCGGSGGSDLEKVAALGCDTFVTADVKHHVFLAASELGVNLIDAGHFSTENVVIAPLADYLRRENPGVEIRVSKAHRQPEEFY